MKTYQIEVDEEIYRYLQNKVEDVFKDNPNSVLRKLLLSKQTVGFNGSDKKTITELPDFPKGIPDALIQLLEVIYLVIKLREDRTMAVKKVAQKHGVEIPTVADKYIRGLNQKTNKFDMILNQSDHNELERILKDKFSDYQEVIGDFFKNL
jgi:hypothetical protein